MKQSHEREFYLLNGGANLGLNLVCHVYGLPKNYFNINKNDNHFKIFVFKICIWIRKETSKSLSEIFKFVFICKCVKLPIINLVHHLIVPYNIYRDLERVQCNQKSNMEIHHHHLLFYLVALAYFFACIEGLNRSDFPAGFVFGAGSSAYQVCMQQ